MTHWHASCLLGLLLTGRWRPLCASVGLLSDSRARRAYGRAMDRAFGEERHVERVTAAWAVGDCLRRG